MDNTADDVLMGTVFTEIWVPIQYTERCMNLLKDMFVNKGLPATGYYSTEIYGSPPTSAWLSPGYSDGSDEYKDGAVRFDVFWYRENEGEPNVKDGFFHQYWDVFLKNGIPFRFHWGKFIPAYDFLLGRPLSPEPAQVRRVHENQAGARSRRRFRHALLARAIHRPRLAEPIRIGARGVPVPSSVGRRAR